jgi:hypothetical protein
VNTNACSAAFHVRAKGSPGGSQGGGRNRADSEGGWVWDQRDGITFENGNSLNLRASRNVSSGLEAPHASISPAGAIACLTQRGLGRPLIPMASYGRDLALISPSLAEAIRNQPEALTAGVADAITQVDLLVLMSVVWVLPPIEHRPRVEGETGRKKEQV